MRRLALAVGVVVLVSGWSAAGAQASPSTISGEGPAVVVASYAQSSGACPQYQVTATGPMLLTASNGTDYQNLVAVDTLSYGYCYSSRFATLTGPGLSCTPLTQVVDGTIPALQQLGSEGGQVYFTGACSIDNITANVVVGLVYVAAGALGLSREGVGVLRVTPH